ncbi:signal peptide-containing protein, partial [Cryptosporidium canis]
HNITSVFAASQTEGDAIQLFNNLQNRIIIADDLSTSISRGWWELSRRLIIKTHEQDIDLSPVVRSAELSIRKELDELSRLLNKKHSEVATLSPAFQWAQSNDYVYLNIKFTYRWNAPGALKIENETVSIKNNLFFFSAMGSHSHAKKKYVLNLELFDNIDPELSEWSFGSVGKLSCTLVKKTPSIWPRLLKDQKLKIPNMHI